MRFLDQKLSTAEGDGVVTVEVGAGAVGAGVENEEARVGVVVREAGADRATRRCGRRQPTNPTKLWQLTV